MSDVVGAMINPGSMYRVVKNYDDDESDIVKGNDKQWEVEEFVGKVAGWMTVSAHDTETEALRAMQQYL